MNKLMIQIILLIIQIICLVLQIIFAVKKVYLLSFIMSLIVPVFMVIILSISYGGKND